MPNLLRSLVFGQPGDVYRYRRFGRLGVSVHTRNGVGFRGFSIKRHWVCLCLSRGLLVEAHFGGVGRWVTLDWRKRPCACDVAFVAGGGGEVPW